MTRRTFLRASVATAAALALGYGVKGLVRRRRPNLLLIISDTLRADHLGCYGSGLGLSPEVDRLAAQGTVFRETMSVAPTTGASHATLFTGTYQARHGIVGNPGRLPANLPTLAEVCREAGYRTAAFVGSDVLDPRRLEGIDRGFGHYDVTLLDSERNRPQSYRRDARDTATAAARWLTAEASDPFFLWVHFMEPHGPYEVRDPAMLEGVRHLPANPGEPARLPVAGSNSAPDGIPPYQVLGSERRPLEYRRRYAACVRYVDRYVGQVLEALRQRPREDTVIVFASDHSELLGEHGYYFQHGITVSQPVLHIPLVLVSPDLPPAPRVTVPVSNVDLMPTLLRLLDLASGDVNRSVQGRDLGPVLARTAAPPAPLFAYCDAGGEWAVRKGDLKYIEAAGATRSRDGLFDLSRDPGEAHDLSAARPEEASKMAELLRPLREEQARTLGRARPPRPMTDEDRRRLKSLGYL